MLPGESNKLCTQASKSDITFSRISIKSSMSYTKARAT